MPFVNYAAREINCKIVYCGAGLSGKTANLQFLHQQFDESRKGKMISLATETDRTLFFDVLPVDLGTVRGFGLRFHLYTVPGHVFYDASQRLVLRGADGVVFVADSLPERMDANLESLADLARNLRSQGYDLATIPYVLQLNKRDAPTALPSAEMTPLLIRQSPPEPVFEAAATTGQGVVESFTAVARRVLLTLTQPH